MTSEVCVGRQSVRESWIYPTHLAREQKGNNNCSSAFPVVIFCTHRCQLSPPFPLPRHIDTEEVDGSNPFGPTIVPREIIFDFHPRTYGNRAGFARVARSKACWGNQAPAAGSTSPHSGSKSAWLVGSVGHPG